MKMIDHNHFICHLILGTFTEYPCFLTDSATVNWTRTDLAVLFLQVFIKG